MGTSYLIAVGKWCRREGPGVPDAVPWCAGKKFAAALDVEEYAKRRVVDSLRSCGAAQLRGVVRSDELIAAAPKVCTLSLFNDIALYERVNLRRKATV
jgi:hypothetical protein